MAKKPDKTYHNEQEKIKLYKSYLLMVSKKQSSTKKDVQSTNFVLPRAFIQLHKNILNSDFFSILRRIDTRTQKIYGDSTKHLATFAPKPQSYRAKQRAVQQSTSRLTEEVVSPVAHTRTGLSLPKFSLAPVTSVFKKIFRPIPLFTGYTVAPVRGRGRPRKYPIPRKVSSFTLPRFPVDEVKASYTAVTSIKLPSFKLPTLPLPKLQKTATVVPVVTKKVAKTHQAPSRWVRLMNRWNRKQRLSFSKNIRQQTPVQKNWFFSALAAPFKPFYYSIRLFPLHSVAAVILSAVIFSGTYALHEMIFKDLPSVMELSTQEPAVSSKITDRNGKLLYTMYKDENRTIVPLSYISPHLVHATISIEDQDFYNHQGFSVRGISRAAIKNFQEGEGVSQGGSTITQQLVKMRLLTSERTFTRKIKEVILSVLVEGAYSKEEILSMYLNQVPYGGSTYGIEEAAQRYFGKSSKDLSIAESALLAGLPAAPSAYSPFGPYPELAKNRQQEVIRRMVEEGYISQGEADQALQEKLAFRDDSIDILAPHFVMYVRQLLEEQYGREQLLTQGLEIRTTLDLEVQNKAQSIVTNEIAAVQRFHITNGAALVTNPHTGEVLAMIGSKNYFDFKNDGQVNVTLQERQPGSSIKPLVYAMALERGSSPTTMIMDQPVSYKIAGSAPYAPKNYDGKFHGNVTLKEALGSSYNIPAVKLLESVGITSMINKGEAMGITTWKERSRYGLSLALGGGEVKMIDMTSLYGAFANDGVAMKANPILEVKNYKGETLYENTCALRNIECTGKKVLDPKVAFLISNMLSDNRARIPAFGPLSDLFIPGQEVAVKTGTTNSRRDNWTNGYTKDRLVTVWVGNNDNTPMSYVASGVTGASPIWNKIMRSLLDDKNPHKFTIPSGIVTASVCGKGGKTEQYFVAGTEPANANCNVATKSEKDKAVTAEVR